jgi:hypothetical protein
LGVTEINPCEYGDDRMAGKLSSVMTNIFDVALILIVVALFMLFVAAKPVYETIINCSQQNE